MTTPLTHPDRRRAPRRTDGPQQITRLPEWRPGMWVKLIDCGAFWDLSGKVRQVKSITCSVTSPDQKAAVWRVHFHDGRCVLPGQVERAATEAEVREQRRKSNGTD